MKSRHAKNYRDEIDERKRKQAKTRRFRLVIVCSMAAVGTVVLLFYAHLFDIRTIDVQSPSLIPADEVRQVVLETLNRRVLGISRKNNSILFSVNTLVPILQKTFPRIESVEIRKKSVHELIVTVKERNPSGLWCLPLLLSCMYYDNAGIAFANVASSSGYLFVPVIDERARTVTLGEIVAPLSLRSNFLEIKKNLQFAHINVASFFIPNDSYNEFHVRTSEGWSIYYRTDTNLNHQTESLLALIKEKFSSPALRSRLEYIDLRIDDRIYYK